MTDIQLTVQPTPNPNALKFILNHKVKEEGNSSYKSPLESSENPLASALFTIRGVDQIHFFDNVITITKFGYEDWENIEPQVSECIQERMTDHNPNYYDPDPAAERRRKLPKEVQAIEEILDKTIRPGLQGDGGDIECLSFEDNVLIVRYQGACGTCPSSTTGTLEAIKGILREELNNAGVEVYIAPEY